MNVSHRQYSSDLVSGDYFLLPNLIKKVCGCRLTNNLILMNSIKEIEQRTQRRLYTRCDQKITVIFKFRFELRIFDFRIFFFTVMYYQSVTRVDTAMLLMISNSPQSISWWSLLVRHQCPSGEEFIIYEKSFLNDIFCLREMLPMGNFYNVKNSQLFL